MVLVTEKVPPQVVQRQNFVPEASGGVSLSAESFHLLVHSLTHLFIPSEHIHSVSALSQALSSRRQKGIGPGFYSSESYSPLRTYFAPGKLG